MPLPLIPGLTVAAKALLKTPAGQAAVKRGSKAVTRFLKREDPKSFAASDAQKAAGQKLQKYDYQESAARLQMLVKTYR